MRLSVQYEIRTCTDARVEHLITNARCIDVRKLFEINRLETTLYS